MIKFNKYVSIPLVRWGASRETPPGGRTTTGSQTPISDGVALTHLTPSENFAKNAANPVVTRSDGVKMSKNHAKPFHIWLCTNFPPLLGLSRRPRRKPKIS